MRELVNAADELLGSSHYASEMVDARRDASMVPQRRIEARFVTAGSLALNRSQRQQQQRNSVIAEQRRSRRCACSPLLLLIHRASNMPVQRRDGQNPALSLSFRWRRRRPTEPSRHRPVRRCTFRVAPASARRTCRSSAARRPPSARRPASPPPAGLLATLAGQIADPLKLACRARRRAPFPDRGNGVHPPVTTRAHWPAARHLHDRL